MKRWKERILGAAAITFLVMDYDRKQAGYIIGGIALLAVFRYGRWLYRRYIA
jgi:hypothetical protein